MSLSSRKLTLVQEASMEVAKARIAFATTDNERVNQHFGSAMQFAVYDVAEQSWQLTELIEFEASPSGHDQNKLQVRIDALQHCAAIYCNAIGSSAVRQLLKLKIKPMNVELDTEISCVLQELIQARQETPRHWLNKFCDDSFSEVNENDEPSQKQQDRLASLLNEEWEP